MSEGSTTRLLSDSEISKAMTCQAQWDFAYGGHLAGSALRSKEYSPLLSQGKAWGRAVAAYHATFGTFLNAGEQAVWALDAALEEDAERQREVGTHDQERHDETRTRLLRILVHYIETCEDFQLDPVLEREINVPLPSRGGQRASTRYRLLAYLDGTREIDGRPWIVEFKLRTTLTPVELIALDRQIRRYAWAWWRAAGERPAGVEVHERLNEAPKTPRLVKSGRKAGSLRPSHAKDQLTTAGAYKVACEEHNEPINPETFEALRSRRWHQVVPILFREGELEEAGREMVSAAKLIRDLDSGELYPVRNARPQNCRGCAYRSICPAPDNHLVDALYERRPAKRNREEEQHHDKPPA